MALRPVSAAEIESLAIGAWILGTGGGGSPYLALLNMRKLYREGVSVSLLDPMDLADDDAGRRRLEHGRAARRPGAADRPAHDRARGADDGGVPGRRFDAVMSLEIGGGNALQPFMAAAVLGLPVVDADCMGRAFPEAQMTSFAIHDLTMYPLTLADVRDNAVVVARAASLEVDGAPLAQGLRRGRLDRVDLQGAAHRQGSEGVRHPLLDDQGDPARRDGAGRAQAPSRIPSRR